MSGNSGMHIALMELQLMIHLFKRRHLVLNLVLIQFQLKIVSVSTVSNMVERILLEPTNVSSETVSATTNIVIWVLCKIFTRFFAFFTQICAFCSWKFYIRLFQKVLCKVLWKKHRIKFPFFVHTYNRVHSTSLPTFSCIRPLLDQAL